MNKSTAYNLRTAAKFVFIGGIIFSVLLVIYLFNQYERLQSLSNMFSTEAQHIDFATGLSFIITGLICAYIFYLVSLILDSLAETIEFNYNLNDKIDQLCQRFDQAFADSEASSAADSGHKVRYTKSASKPEITPSENTWTCPNCGKVLYKNMTTCSCGEPRPFDFEDNFKENKASKSASSDGVCPFCLSQNTPDAMFCGQCGYKLK